MTTSEVVLRVAVNLTFTGFLGALLCYALYMGAVPRAQLRALGTAAVILAFFANAVAMVARYVVADHVPLSNLYESLLYVTLVMSLLFLVVYRTYPLPALGAGVGLLGVLAIAYASLVIPTEYQAAAPLMPALQSYWLKIHVSIIVASYGAFALACVTAAAQLLAVPRTAGGAPERPAVTDAGIHLAVPTPEDANAAAMPTGEAPGSAMSLPAHVAFWDNLTYRLIAFGFPLLTVGIIAGAVWAKHAWGTYWSWDPKENWSLITLFIYALYLHGRQRLAWTAERRATLAIVGFAAVLITYVGVNYFAGGLHSYAFGE